MKPQSLHAHEDRLLDFAYGELPPTEARAMEAHLQGCARCTEALDGIRGVRATMSQLSLESAPDAGLESLLAYAQQSARRAAEGPVSTPSRWRRWLLPAMGLASVTFIGLVSHQVAKQVDLRPSFSELAKNSEEAKKDVAQAKSEAYAPAAEAPSQAPAGVAATPKPAPEPEERPLEEKAFADKSGRELLKKKAPTKSLRADWSNSGSAGGFPQMRSKYRSRDDEGEASVGAVQAIPPTPAAQAELRQQAPAAPMTQAPPPPPPAEAAAADEDLSRAEAEPVAQAEQYEERVPESQAPKYAPPRSSLRLGGSSTPRGGGGAAPAAAGALADTAVSESLPPPAAAPPVATAAPAAPTPSKPARARAAEADDGFGALLGSTKESAPAKKKAAGPSASQLSERANAAYRSGDRSLEASLLRQALVSGASGRERLGLLIRLCDAEFALGRRDAAIEACGQVLSEDPDSSAAQVARRRLSRESGDAEPAAPAAPPPVKR